MYKHSRTIFNELLDFIPWKKFEALIGQHRFDRYKKSFSWYNLLLVLMYAQITGKDSLRDIETSLSVHKNLHYHLWIKSIKRTTIAYNNKTCPHEIFENVFYELLKQVQWFYQNKRFNFYSLDSTTISTSLNLIPRAKHRTTKWAVKMHVLLNNQNLVPDVIEWDITIVKMSHSKCAPIHRLNPGEYNGLVIISRDGEVNVFDNKELVQKINEKFPWGWIGWDWLLVDSIPTCYWGWNPNLEELEEFVREYANSKKE